MSRINEKLGLKPAGKRSMMKLPDDRALRVALTSAKCPKCDRRGARLCQSKGSEGNFWCSHCGHEWTPELPEQGRLK